MSGNPEASVRHKRLTDRTGQCKSGHALIFVWTLAFVSSIAAQTPTQSATEQANKPATVPFERLSSSHLPNAIRLHPKVISGGQPEGEPAFQELHALGIKTIISVDGARPDVEGARKYGIRYVHLPHGYDGVPEERARMLAKAVQECEGPIYIHCHHGKHRSPTAAAVACVGCGLLDPSRALTLLQLAGTSENYRGLYQSATSAKRFEQSLLENLEADFPETAALPRMAEAMVAIEHTFDHLKRFSARDWRHDPLHPDLDPAHEALLLREHYTELLRAPELNSQPMEFQQRVEESEQACVTLEADLRRWTSIEAARRPTVPESIPHVFQRVSQQCTDCHKRFRDIPLSEKLSTPP